jgi:hypothetical protein
MEFSGVIEARELRGAAVPLPVDPVTVFGRARAPVTVSVNGNPPYRTTVAIYAGVGWIGVRKEQRAQYRVDVGDTVTLQVERDDAPREVVPPPELARALEGDDKAMAMYNSLSYTHRREYARWVEEAKRQETRDRRADRAVEMLRVGRRDPG